VFQSKTPKALAKEREERKEYVLHRRKKWDLRNRREI
jgi:hypothetical protein